MSADETMPGAPPEERPRDSAGDCPDCGATGKVGDKWCTTCAGTGRISA